MPDLHLPPGLRYSCIQCGECCRTLEVTLTDDEHGRLAEHDWQEGLPDYEHDRYMAPMPPTRGRQTWRLRPLATGACRFLADDDLCRVHAELGYGGKPFAGRLFPFTFCPTPVGVFVGVRFNCPAVVRGEGMPLEEQRRDIARLYKEYARVYSPPRAPEQVQFFGRMALGWRDVLRIEDQLRAFLLMTDLPFPMRLLACRRLTRRLVGASLASDADAKIGADPDAVLSELALTVSKIRRPGPTERVLLRLLSAAFLGAVLPSFRELPFHRRLGVRLGRLLGRARDAVGMGRLPLPGTGASAPLRDIARVDVCNLDAASTDMLTRYFVTKLSSQSFFGLSFFGRSFAEGIDFLACTYGVLMRAAAGHAILAGRTAVTDDDVEYAIRQVDYGFNYLGEFGGFSERIRSILFWQWGTPEKVLASLLP
ncbi:YkgJ family cysteine cluster protein [bacterium]|nr:YkgJ family cysteine cluster protein [bacterium]